MSEEKKSFQEKLNLMITELDLKSQDIAFYAGFDRTNISHFRSGKRLPAGKGPAVEKLVNGLLLCAENNGKLSKLRQLIGADKKSNGKRLYDELVSWLFDGMPDQAAGNRGRKQGDARLFGERLDSSMKLAEISNSRFGQLLNVDASLISRFRSGKRLPHANSEIMEMLGTILWQRIVSNGKEKELAEVMACEDPTEEDFYTWLFRVDYIQEQDISATEKLLKSFEAWSPNAMESIIPEDQDFLDAFASMEKKELYRGVQGIREAVLRFLSEVIESREKEILLFSEEGTGWMTDDRTFQMKWAALMKECVKRGVRFRIIHNIDRDLNEMIGAIQSWLPLYMSAMIEPWYLQKKRDARFSHTMFLCPGHFAIEAVHVVGMESEGLYHYYTDGEHLELFRREFEKMVDLARPLISFSHSDLSLPVTAEVSLKKTRIIMHPKAVSITRVDMPQFFFSFSHPAMTRAFRGYIEHIQKTNTQQL